MNIYETGKLLSEYLLFHYGSAAEILPWAEGPTSALDYTVRCVTECLDPAKLPSHARALDLGCAVGRSSFELARFCEKVIGIDFSRQFIAAASALKSGAPIPYDRVDEGVITTRLEAVAPAGVSLDRVTFEIGDATQLRDDLGTFDLVLMANLIDRLPSPQKCLARLPSLVRSGGQLIITSPYTWLEEFTPKENWLSGDTKASPSGTRDVLIQQLGSHFELMIVKDLPFLIREHARKFQWSVAEATIWRRR